MDKKFFLVGLFILSMGAKAEIVCKTMHGEKEFVVDGKKISFFKTEASGQSRSISSSKEDLVRTQVKHNGFIKTLYLDGNKYQIKVLDVTKFDESRDYLSIRSPKGHEMTYPLICHSV